MKSGLGKVQRLANSLDQAENLLSPFHEVCSLSPKMPLEFVNLLSTV